MRGKFKFSLILVFVLIISLGSASANEINTEINVSDNLEVSEIQNDANDLYQSSNEYIISNSNYNQYFDEEGNILDTSGLNDGDAIRLSGTFNNQNFIISKQLNVVGEGNVLINNGTFNVLSSGSGSILSNLIIRNVGTDMQGILLSNASYCTIDNNNIQNSGRSSFTIALNPGSSYNNITNNILKTSGITGSGTASTSTLILGGANYNYIANNYLENDDANAIYLSAYGSGSFVGGNSNFNLIYNNTVRCMVIPTSWCYGIQLMGTNNRAESNTVIGTYRGISTGANSTVVNNKLINLTGRDFSNGELVGGDYAIITGSYSSVINNTITNSLIEGAGIRIGDNSVIMDNNVDIIGTGYGVDANGNDIDVVGNIISTQSGAVVYQVGRLSGLTVSNNQLISSSGVGVSIKKASNSRYPSEIEIVNNVIATSNEYAIDAADADQNSYRIFNNTISGNSRILTPNGEITPGIEFEYNGVVYNITPDDYHVFFDDNGNMINPDVKDGDIFNFSGEFNNINPIISSAIKITGENPIFHDSTFTITSGGVWIENLTISNTNQIHLNPWGIYAENVESIMITNNNIHVEDENAAYAIYLLSVSNAIVEDNYLSSSGDYLTYTFLGCGLENSYLRNNIIVTNGTGQIHAYEASKCIDGVHDVNEIYRTYGILLITSSDNEVENNTVTVTSKLETPHATINGSLSTNTVVGIDAYFDCDNNIFNDNTIVIEANDNYIYGMGIIGAETQSGSSQYSSNNQFTNNSIKITGHNFGSGIMAGYNSQNIIISGNIIDINVDDVAYGVTLEYAQENDVEGNTINLVSDVNYVIELFFSNGNTIYGNDLKADGEYSYGIGGYGSNQNIISTNNITVAGQASVPIEETQHYDALGVGNAGVMFRNNSNNNVIINNNITSSRGYAVNLTGVSGNNVINNCLIGQSTLGDGAVLNALNNNVSENYAYKFTNPSIINVNGEYLGEIILTANSGIANDNDSNVFFYINDMLVGSATTVNGQASLTIRLNSSYIPGTYEISAEFKKENYPSANESATLNISRGTLTIDLNNVSGMKGTAVEVIAIVENSLGDLLEGITVEFYRDSIYIGRATSDENGIARFVYTIPSSISGNSATISALINGNNYYNGANATATLMYTQLIQTEIVLNDFVMFYRNGTRLVGQLVDLSGNPISGENVTIIINGVPYLRTIDDDGYFSMVINLMPGIHQFRVNYNGSADYYSSSNSAQVTVLSTIEGEDIVKIFRNGTQYYATFLDGEGNPLANTDVTFNINGVMYTRQTNASGVARLNINLNPGTYIITATNPVNGQQYSNTITVLPSIVENYDLVKYYRNSSQYLVKVLDSQGNAVVGENVTFNINGVLYNRVTNSEGYAQLSINLNPGNYIITASYGGYSVSNDITVLPTITASDLVKNYGEPGTYDVAVVDGQGNPVVGQNVTININGVFYNRLTDSNGVARLNINLLAGEYIATAYYGTAAISNRVTVRG